MLVLLLPLAIVVWTLVFAHGSSLRIAWLKSLIVFGTACVLISELLSVWTGLNQTSVASFWVVASLAGGILAIRRRPRIAFRKPSLVGALCAMAVSVTVGLIAWAAILSPPNSADAMSYHLPRILYWVQNSSVAFFPTGYLNQIMLQPATEYIMLQTHLLFGNDHFVNLVQTVGWAGCIVAVSCIVEALGGSRRAQLFAALFCATLPNGILQASGAKNDVVLALWLACAAFFASRWIRSRSLSDLLFLSLAAALAFGTKGTAYLFLPPMLVAILLSTGGLTKIRRREWATALAFVCGAVLLLNGPQFLRNLELSGSPLGFDSAHGDGFFRWRNEEFGWKPTVSNALRNVSEQLGGRSEEWNRRVYDDVLRIHRLIGADPQDPKTTWRWSEYIPPRNSNHEANANNRWHLLLAAAAIFAALYRAEKSWLYYAIGPAGGFLLFCAYLKWQPYFSRLELPLFVLSSPLVALAADAVLPGVLQLLLCLFLLDNARLPLTENWTRPITGPNRLQSKNREANYFNDMGQWNNVPSYLETVQQISNMNCRLVGTDVSRNHVEYPLQVLLRELKPDVRFVHTGVKNASSKYGRVSDGRPCVVVCLDCADDPQKKEEYGEYPEVRVIGRFLLFTGVETEKRSAASASPR